MIRKAFIVVCFAAAAVFAACGSLFGFIGMISLATYHLCEIEPPT